MSIIKITGSGAYEHTQETNHSLEYLKRTLTEHKIKPTLDHPDGSVTEEKLSAEVRDRMNKHESDIQELNEKKADKSELDTKADKSDVYFKTETEEKLSFKADKADIDKEFDEVKENLSGHVFNNDCHFMYGEREEINQRISSLKTTKADKSTTYTIAQTDTKLSTKADKADVLSLQELATLNNEHVMTHDTDIRNLTEDKANKTDVYFLQQWCDNLNENKADRSELPTKVSQLENDTNYVTNTDYATSTVSGVVRIDGNYGIFHNGKGVLQTRKATDEEIELKSNIFKPITPSNLEYAVEVCTNQTMSDDTAAQGQLPASYDAVKGYVDDGLSTKANKSDLDWKLIGEEEVTAADITAAGEAGVTAVTIDLGAPIEQWYRETRIDIFIPVSNSINSGKKPIVVNLGNSESTALIPAATGGEKYCTLIYSQSASFASTDSSIENRIMILTDWNNKTNVLYTQVLQNGANSHSYPYYSFGVPLTTHGHYATGKQYLAFYSSGKNFKFPAGTKISLYGRM